LRNPITALSKLKLEDQVVTDKDKLKKADSVEADREDLLVLAKEDPFKAAVRCQKRVKQDELTADQNTRRRLAEAYASAYHMRKNKDARERLLAHPFWEKRKKKPKLKDLSSANCLRTVVIFVYRAINQVNYDRAYKHALALEGEFEKGTKPSEIESILEDRGLTKMIEEGFAAKKEMKSHAKRADGGDKVSGDVADGKRGGEGQDREEDEQQSKGKKKSRVIRVRVPKWTWVGLSSLPVGEEITARFRRLDEKDVFGDLRLPDRSKADDEGRDGATGGRMSNADTGSPSRKKKKR
jgi:hypothetical protein